MAANVLRRGFKVFGYDVDGSACKKLEAVGMTTCASPAEAARQAEVVITMLPTEVEVEAVCLGPAGVVEGARAGLLLVEMSTIDPDASRSIAGRLRERGIEMIDAPVARGSKEAEEGKLLIFVGGTEQQLQRARPLLECMGEIILHIGPQGQALAEEGQDGRVVDEPALAHLARSDQSEGRFLPDRFAEQVSRGDLGEAVDRADALGRSPLPASGSAQENDPHPLLPRIRLRRMKPS
jgi:hypothetical protein